MMGQNVKRAIGASPYHQAFDRIRAEYVEMPGMRLTLRQVQRLSGVDVTICQAVLEDLVRAGFLRTGIDGAYLRTSPDGPAAVDRELRRPGI